MNTVRSHDETSDEECSENEEELMLGSMKYSKEGKYVGPSYLSLYLDNHVVEFEVDTGACVTVMSSIQFSNFFMGV